MNFVLKGTKVYEYSGFKSADMLICGNRIIEIGGNLVPPADCKVIELNNCVVFPGLIDVHVHLREPGFSYKETVESGTLAAAHGGYTSVCAMPNLNPCPDCTENLKLQLDIIKQTSKVHVYPYASVTRNEKGKILSDLDALSTSAIAFSDDGRGIQNDDMMKSAMLKAKSLNKMIVAHCEDNSLLDGGYIHKGEYARLHNHRGISSESEYRQIERDLRLAEETGCKYHVCHISAKESVELIRKAKKKGLDVSCETAPHYLVLNDMMLQENGRFKMNPPIRSEEDRLALINGIKDGTIDIIATDHAPHSAEEKSRGLEKSLMGITGLETAFPILYTKLVKTNIITLDKLIELLHINPSERFKIGTSLAKNNPADFTVFDLNAEYLVNPAEFLSKGKSTPFENEKVFGKCKLTVVDGQIIWEDK